MLIYDKVYGYEDIKEPIILELISSPTLQRLKGISQQGMPREYYHREIFSRFDHSIGVMILLKKLGADLNEQIAGLLHDISHTAFSHVIDWVIGDPSKEDYQDNIFFEMLKKSEIPSILKKYNFNIEKLSDLKSFNLLEKEAPSLCADRIDYSLRELVDLGQTDDAKFLVNNLVCIDGQIAFKTNESAEKFGKSYAKLQREHWAGNEAKARYYILANILRIALSKSYISVEDFKKTDYEILDILKKTNNKQILGGLNKLKSGFIIKETIEKEDGIILKKKFRYVDPEVYIDGILKNLSLISKEYQIFINNEKEHQNKIIKIKID
jgi:HD superfamily phosphohydrolase